MPDCARQNNNGRLIVTGDYPPSGSQLCEFVITEPVDYQNLLISTSVDDLYALAFSLGLMIIFSLGWIAGHQR